MLNVSTAITELLNFFRQLFESFFESRKSSDSINCLVGLQNHPHQPAQTTFTLKIRGTIHAPKDKQQTLVRIIVTDLTDGIAKALPAHSTDPQFHLDNSDVFCYKTELGKLPRTVTTLSRWIVIAEINAGLLLLPRKGKRRLLFVVTIFSPDENLELAATYCTFLYNNPCDGYLDLDEKQFEIKILSARLSFAVACANDRLTYSEIDMVKNWVFSSAKSSPDQDKKTAQLHDAVNWAVRMITRRKSDISLLCEQIVPIASFPDRCRILDFCMNLAKAKGYINQEKLVLLNQIAEKLEIEKELFLNMAEKILPPDICRVDDEKILLGITPGMDDRQAKKLLNQLYHKWSARVTNYNPDVRQKAAFMLKYIAQARSEYETRKPLSTP